jgi:D-alanyl-lipoteichoic acid acyltransferase DltB (MBOAT superfamily)
MELLNLMFASFWHFVGFTIVLTGVANFFLLLINRIMRHRNIRKHGWPPVHIDGDGDFKKTEQ